MVTRISDSVYDKTIKENIRLRQINLYIYKTLVNAKFLSVNLLMSVITSELYNALLVLLARIADEDCGRLKPSPGSLVI